MSYLSEATRARVRQRAKNRCEYCLCHQDFVFAMFQIDHIWPVSLGGMHEEENLCLACEMCNQYKWARVEGIDPLSGKQASLFNPRQDHWNDHFIWSEDGTEIVGLTETGRATIAVLRMNNKFAVTVRKNWCNVGWHPPELE